MTLNDVYRVNGPRVISENIDGELILVNMERGTYYSTDGVGAEIWRFIEEGCCISEMCDAILAQYEAGPDEIRDTVFAFIARLEEEGLVTNGDWRGEGSRPSGPRPVVKRSFQRPVLQGYRDMQDMLSLDPIHDVEAAGWPVPKLDEDSSEATA